LNSAPDRLPADGRAIALMVLLSGMWGLNQVCIKFAEPGVSLVMQACLRSAIAAALLFLWTRLRGIVLFNRDGSLWPGLSAGLLFAAEFAFIHAGLNHTSAARMVVFVYLAPVFTALGLALLIPGERLKPLQWAGIMVAFAGMATAFAEGFGSLQGSTWKGDLMGMIGALLWALTTILVRTTVLSNAPAAKTLLYQLAFAGATLPLVSMALGESGIGSMTPVVVGAMLYQGVLVAFASYLTWFWLLTRYWAAQLSVFSFLTPLFGVAFGVVLLGDHVSGAFVTAALLVGAGIALVNLPQRKPA
jgi:drug/metabolite transporter (DMT)-like permease